METKHLTYFKVENFKRFDSFEMNDIGQFNLIVGDNNVGKTSVLEALLFDEDLEVLLSNLEAVLNGNELHFDTDFNFIELFSNKYSIGEAIRFVFAYQEIERKELQLEIIEDISQLTEEEKTILLRRLFYNTVPKYVAVLRGNKTQVLSLDIPGSQHFPLITLQAGYREDLVSFYSQYFQINKKFKTELINNLKTFIPRIDGIEVLRDYIPESSVIGISLLDLDKILPLAMFGEGSIKLFRILVEIAVVKKHRLMIDEIDAGIHYSRFKDFWRTIIKSAKANEVQIFATTHNLECLRYFKEVLEEEEMQEYQKDARSFTLIETPRGEVKSVKYNFEAFEFAIENDNEIRGGRR